MGRILGTVGLGTRVRLEDGSVGVVRGEHRQDITTSYSFFGKDFLVNKMEPQVQMSVRLEDGRTVTLPQDTQVEVIDG